MKMVSHDHADILCWEEDITIKNIEDFSLAMQQFIKRDKSWLILDLSSVAYLNSSVLGIIAHSVLEARRQRKELVVAGIQKTVEEIFRIVKFSSFIRLFNDREQALTFVKTESEGLSLHE